MAYLQIHSHINKKRRIVVDAAKHQAASTNRINVWQQGLIRYRIKYKCEVSNSKNIQKHTTAGVRWWSPTQLLICRLVAYLWGSRRDPEFSTTYGRMCLVGYCNNLYQNILSLEMHNKNSRRVPNHAFIMAGTCSRPKKPPRICRNALLFAEFLRPLYNFLSWG
jgi:hypothetical protein